MPRGRWERMVVRGGMGRIGTGRFSITARAFVLAGVCAFPAALLALTLLHTFAPRRDGMVALTQVFAPYFFLALLALVPLALLRGAGALRLLLVACCVVGGARFAPRVTAPAPVVVADAPRVTVMNWNMFIANGEREAARQFLLSRPAEIVALQEVDERWLAAEPALARVYPHRSPPFVGGAREVAVLSTYPIVEYHPFEVRGVGSASVAGLWVRLKVGGGRTLAVATAHPVPPATAEPPCGRPLCYAPYLRDAQLRQIRAAVEPLLGRGEPLLLLGDFNVTEREPAYRELTAGLRDAHVVAGRGLGLTWRPYALMGREWPVLRIDYLLSGPTVTPLHTAVDCRPRGSDHCAVFGTFAVE